MALDKIVNINANFALDPACPNIVCWFVSPRYNVHCSALTVILKSTITTKPHNRYIIIPNINVQNA